MARTGSQLSGFLEAPLGRGPTAPAVAATVALVAVVVASVLGGVGTAAGATGSSATATPGPAQSSLAFDSTGTIDATGSPEPTGTPSPTSTPVSTKRTIGHSVRGRAIVLERFGSGSRRLLIVAGIHGDEYGGPLATRFAEYLRKHPSTIPSGTCIDIIAYANPDGRVLKRRTNAHKVDLNRNFPASNWTRWHAPGTSSHGRRPASEPETRAIMWQLKRGHYTRVLALHSRGGVVDYNGKGAHKLAHRVAKAAHIRVLRLPKFPGSMGSYAPERFHDPVITWELSSRKLTKRVRAGLFAWVR